MWQIGAPSCTKNVREFAACLRCVTQENPATFSAMENIAPKPGPHLSPVQPSSLGDLAERHARHASSVLNMILTDADLDDAQIDAQVRWAEVHAAVARACAHAAIAVRPLHSARVVKL